MINETLLQLICCPETHQSLASAPPDLLAQMEALRAKGKLVNRAGQQIEDVLDDVLIRDDGKIAYPVVDGIPVLIIEEGILVDELEDRSSD